MKLITKKGKVTPEKISLSKLNKTLIKIKRNKKKIKDMNVS